MRQQEHIHFIGIGGSGMSAIAKVLMEMGYRVSGSDLCEHELLKQLEAQGGTIYVGHQAEHIEGADYVVYSSGIPEDNIERLTAQAKCIPLLHRSQMLAKILNQKHGIAVTGAHGKTTTSSMITWMMTEAGLDPTFLIGGEVLDFGYNAKAGQSPFVVAEADDSDSSFLKYYPKVAVITNIEEDHLENYKGDFQQLKEAYVQFIRQIQPHGTLITCADDLILMELVQREEIRSYLTEHHIEWMTYSLYLDGATIRANEIQLKNRSSSFQVVWLGSNKGCIRLSIPGIHNIQNALAAVTLGLKLGISIEFIQKSLCKFIGAKRRFQVISEEKDVLVVDDYAHHPTEIMATIEAAKFTGRRIIAVFQPQRYTRTYFLLDAFSYAFSEADQVFITDIYSPSGEKPIKGVSSEELVNRIYKNSNTNVQYIKCKTKLVQNLIELAEPGDLILTMGAGDIWKVAYEMRSYYSKS